MRHLRVLAPLALSVWAESATADCALLRSIQNLSPLVDAVLADEGDAALFELHVATRRLDAAAVQSALALSRPELVLPISDYLFAVRGLIQSSNNTWAMPGVARGRALINSMLADGSCPPESARATEKQAGSGGGVTSSPTNPATSRATEIVRRSPISKRELLISCAGAAVALMLAIVLLILRGRKHISIARPERLPCRYPTRLLVGGAEYPCLAVDFSETGCKTTLPKGFPNVRNLEIVLDERTLAAEIAWRGEWFTGIKVLPGVPAALLATRKAALKRGDEKPVAL